MSHLALVALVVRDYDAAIRFFVDVLQFQLVEDTQSLTNDGRPKRWVVVRPRGGETGILLARADGEHQASVVGQQFAGRVGLFLRVDDCEASYERMIEAGVRFVSPPRDEACTAESRSSSTWRGTVGTCWARFPAGERQPASADRRRRFAARALRSPTLAVRR